VCVCAHTLQNNGFCVGVGEGVGVGGWVGEWKSTNQLNQIRMVGASIIIYVDIYAHTHTHTHTHMNYISKVVANVCLYA
jgi:hypothetical protein